ncbi:MAG: STAS domain-containing protein [Gammaproteobacteria bacterium]|nr:STAS domain-containing protein [Gammaproteobacteria bacterium]MBU1654488.1 STAS domain-containing protein [Gammaproteobacteria bacterium]MBU1960140.1 STAS domain-containing protein [Gammaproteobacteria bacterium]
MQVTKNDVGGVTVIEIGEKRFDASVAPDLKQYVLDLVGAGQNRIVIDLGIVEFIDSSGLGSLVGVLKGIGANGQLAVCNVQSQARDLFKLTRMDRVLNIHSSADEAVASIS